MDKLTNSVKINDVSPNDFVALYVPGGHGAPQQPDILEEYPADMYFPFAVSGAVERNMLLPSRDLLPSAWSAIMAWLQNPCCSRSFNTVVTNVWHGTVVWMGACRHHGGWPQGHEAPDRSLC